MRRYIARHPNDQNPQSKQREVCGRAKVKRIRVAQTCPRGCNRPPRLYPSSGPPTAAEAGSAIPIESSTSSSSSDEAEQRWEGSTTEEDPDLTEDEMPTYLGPFSRNPEPEPEPESGFVPLTQTFYFPEFTSINAPPRSTPRIRTSLPTIAVPLPTAASSTVQILDTPSTRPPTSGANHHPTTLLQLAPQIFPSFSTITGIPNPVSSTVQTLGRLEPQILPSFSTIAGGIPNPASSTVQILGRFALTPTPEVIVHSQPPLFAPKPKAPSHRLTITLPPRTIVHSPSPLFSPITPPPQDHDEKL